MLSEKILAAAIWHGGRIYSVPLPGRHHDVIHLMSALGFGPEAMHNQGFITEIERFVDRCEALELAKEAGQVVQKHGKSNELFSEDVW